MIWFVQVSTHLGLQWSNHSSRDSRTILRYIHQRIGLTYLRETAFEEAGDSLFRGSTDPRLLIRLFPGFHQLTTSPLIPFQHSSHKSAPCSTRPSPKLFSTLALQPPWLYFYHIVHSSYSHHTYTYTYKFEIRNKKSPNSSHSPHLHRTRD